MYDPVDDAGVPVSAGIPAIVRWTGLFGLVLVFVIVGLVIFAARHGHIWPALDSTHLKLG